MRTKGLPLLTFLSFFFKLLPTLAFFPAFRLLHSQTKKYAWKRTVKSNARPSVGKGFSRNSVLNLGRCNNNRKHSNKPTTQWLQKKRRNDSLTSLKRCKSVRIILKPSGVQRYQKNSKENSNTNFSTEGSLYWTLNRRFYYILNYLW